MAKDKKPTPKEIYWTRKRKEEQEKAALLPVGMVNHGNTCFMNTVLQGLVATHLLEELIRFQTPDSSRFMASRRSPLMTNGRGPEDIQQSWTQGMSIGDIFVHIMERAWRMRDAKDRSSMSPKELLARLGEKYDQYLDFRQQDAHEFFLHLVDGMRMEEFDIIRQRQPKPLSNSSKRRPQKKGLSACTIPGVIPEEDRLTSFVDMLWGGKLTSVLICATCKHVSQTYEEFDDLSLSITHDESKERKRDRFRAFAHKLMSSSNRSRDHGHGLSWPQSTSQPPSPRISTTTLEHLERPLMPHRSRSFEASPHQASVPESETERRKVDMIAGLEKGMSESGLGGSSTYQLPLRSRKEGEVGLGKLGKRISSVGMSLSGKKERKSDKVEKGEKRIKTEGTMLNGRSNEYNQDSAAASPAHSQAPSRSASPKPMKKPRAVTKQPELSEYDAQKAAYLRRLLQDTVPNLSNPLTVLRMAHSNGVGVSTQWSKIGSTQGVEDCLRMFTSVEALEGDNMFGCRNCWKLANGQIPEKRSSRSDGDSDDSSDSGNSQQEGQQPQPQVFDSMQSFSMPNLPPSSSGGRSLSSLSRTATSSLSHVPTKPALSEVAALNSSTSDFNLEPSASTSVSSFTATLESDDALSHIKQPFMASHDEKDLSIHPFMDGVGSRVRLIPIIGPVSPPPDSIASNPLGLVNLRTDQIASQPNHTHYTHVPNTSNASAPFVTSLRLPEARSHHRHRSNTDGESSISSEDSEPDDTSGVSDGDASLASAHRLVDTRRPRGSSLSRSKQIIYRRALKRYLIALPPPVLVIHLKRFQQVSKSPVTLFGNLKKLDDYISFPEYLDIRPFLAPKKEDYGLGKGDLRGNVIEKGKREEDQPCVYRLFAVVVHIGNMLGGHYIAYTALPSLSTGHTSATRNRAQTDSMSSPSISEKGHGAEPATKQERQWCYISDTIVRLASLEEVLHAKAYMCMYERVR